MSEGLSTRLIPIAEVRGQRVMLDADLASLYGVETRVLLQQVRRNHQRFPDDFMFQLTAKECENLRSQSVISSSGHGGRRTAPFAFTEHGVAMLSSVLRSDRAISVNIEIMRAFVALRRDAADLAELRRTLAELERATEARFAEHDHELAAIFSALKQLLEPPTKPHRPIGFRVRDEEED